MVDDEAPSALQEAGRADAMAKHSENACTLAVRDSVEALKDARDITIVVLHHWMATILGIRL